MPDRERLFEKSTKRFGKDKSVVDVMVLFNELRDVFAQHVSLVAEGESKSAFNFLDKEGNKGKGVVTKYRYPFDKLRGKPGRIRIDIIL